MNAETRVTCFHLAVDFIPTLICNLFGFCRLGVLPLELNRLLIIVVVLSMALTPLLNELGRTAAEYIEREFEDSSTTDSVCRPRNLGFFVCIDWTTSTQQKFRNIFYIEVAKKICAVIFAVFREIRANALIYFFWLVFAAFCLILAHFFVTFSPCLHKL